MTTEKGARPVVTVIMPAFNSAQTLRESAQSVLDQSVDSLELIVIDDRSSDGTAAIAAELASSDSRVRLVRRSERGGPAAARNDGIAAARGRYLAFCDADDLWLPTKLERQLDVAAATGAALLYSSYHRVDADFAGSVAGFRSEGRVVEAPTRLTHAQLLRANVVGCLTAVVDTRQTGPVQMPDLPGAEDWALWLRILREGGLAVGITEPLALYRAASPGSHSAQRQRAVRAVWQVLRTEERLSVPSALLHLVTDIVAALRKSRI
ncbi:glycosyltransferase family 2 protein [Gryllotalpicola reticulitermitis]|uniref:Glycosyltransferase family 2 protein n=1 Tax=Gryllotalpicola reticulitermitis TaxID=1184153 RepID=A0ABV8Q7S6_9MICO